MISRLDGCAIKLVGEIIFTSKRVFRSCIVAVGLNELFLCVRVLLEAIELLVCIFILPLRWMSILHGIWVWNLKEFVIINIVKRFGDGSSVKLVIVEIVGCFVWFCGSKECRYNFLNMA